MRAGELGATIGLDHGYPRQEAASALLSWIASREEMKNNPQKVVAELNLQAVVEVAPAKITRQSIYLSLHRYPLTSVALRRKRHGLPWQSSLPHRAGA